MPAVFWANSSIVVADRVCSPRGKDPELLSCAWIAGALPLSGFQTLVSMSIWVKAVRQAVGTRQRGKVMVGWLTATLISLLSLRHCIFLLCPVKV